MMRLKHVVAALLLCLTIDPARAITYEVNLTLDFTGVGPDFNPISSQTTVTGEIVTTGALGFISNSDIVRWNFEVANPGLGLTSSSFSPGASFNIPDGTLFATPDTLTHDFTVFAGQDTFFQSSAADSGASSVTVDFRFRTFGVASGDPNGGVITASIRDQDDPSFGLQAFVDASGADFVIATAVPVTAVPLPAALPLLAAGLGVLGALGLRRRRAA